MSDLLAKLMSEIENHVQVEVTDLPENRISVEVSNPKIGSGGLILRDLRVRQANSAGSGSASSKWRSILTPGQTEVKNIRRGYKSQTVTVEAYVDKLVFELSGR